MGTQPVPEKLLLARRQHVLDLMGTSLQGLKKADVFGHIQSGGTHIQTGKGGGLVLLAVSLYPYGEKLVERQAGAVHGWLGIVEEFIFRFFQRCGLGCAEKEIFLPHEWLSAGKAY